MRGNYFAISLSIVLLSCNTHNINYKPESRIVSAVSDSARIYAEISLKAYKGELKNELRYHWYSADIFGANYGGYNGYLLNGNYKRVNLNGNLLEQGVFVNGLKDGIWKYWYPNGNLKRVENWRKGINRDSLEYGKDGSLVNSNKKNTTSEIQIQTDSTSTKTPWYKRIFKKNRKESEVNGSK
ncbi:MAG TPA: hypothetical protein DIW31_11790 [Bacteroidales bacterium]|nr:hypothetical protein [Bacteroidales bacterium]